MVDQSAVETRLQAILNSFVSVQEDITDHDIQNLTDFVNQQTVGDFTSDQIRERVEDIKDQDQMVQMKRQQVAELFAPDHLVRPIRFGSPFCPNCHMFKNYDKECPYCQYLEITY